MAAGVEALAQCQFCDLSQMSPKHNVSFLGGQDHSYCNGLGCLALQCLGSSEPDGGLMLDDAALTPQTSWAASSMFVDGAVG